MHGGHRQRLRKRFLQTGFRGMAEHEALELLLTYAIPRADVNPLAHALMEQYGSLRSVLNADAAAIARTPGCGESTAALLALVRELARELELPDVKNAALTTPEQAAMYLRARLRGMRNECVYALFLSSGFRLIDEYVIAEGTIDQSALYPRRIVERALSLGAAAVILAHNHPGDNLQPGRADVEATADVCAALKTVDIHLIEHYIVAERGVYGVLTEKFIAPVTAQGRKHEFD